jgi:hypothetical protein
VLTDFQPVNMLGNLWVLARLLNSLTEIGVSERDAVFVAAGGIDNLAGRDGTPSLNPVALPPSIGGGRVGDLFAVAVSGTPVVRAAEMPGACAWSAKINYI